MSAPVLRVLSWNVRDMLGDPDAVHRVLRAARPDVACLQEVSRWPGSRHRLAELARAAGLFFTCGGRSSAGTAILTSLRTEVRASGTRRLPVTGRRTRPRGWVQAAVALPGAAPVEVAGVHLGLSAAERADHVARVLDARLDQALPLVLAGDLNEPPGGPSWTALGQVLCDPGADAPPTFPARAPRVRIDVVLLDPRLRAEAYGWPGGVAQGDVLAASDHLPVLAQVRLPAA